MRHTILRWMQVLVLLSITLNVGAAESKAADNANNESAVRKDKYAAEPEPDAKIVYVDGMPKISLNGEIIKAEFNQSGAHNEYKVRAARKMASLGVKINQITLRPSEYEMESGVYSFKVYEEKVLQLLEAVPDARILLLVRMEFPKWLEAHPTEGVQYANGPMESSGDERINRVARPTAASQAYRAEVKNFLKQIGEYTCSQPWGKRVVAIRPCWGVYTEWHMYAFDQGPDIGPAMTAAFHRWKGGMYAGENPPTMEERMDKEDPFFLDREKHQKVIDYFDCMANEVSDCLLETAHAAKEAFPGRLVGMYYGYVMTSHSPEGANCMLDKVLASPDIDFLSNPADYTKESRLAGGAYYHRTIPETFHRYGKLAMLEDDMRHYHVYDQISHQYICTRSKLESEMVTRRTWLNQYFDGCGIQNLDPETNQEDRPFLLDNPQVWRGIKKTKKVLDKIGGRPECSGNEVAVVVDWRGRYQRASGIDEEVVFYQIYKYSAQGLYASGVPFDLMTLDDFLAKPENSYSKVVFLNVVDPQGEMRDELQKRVSGPDVKSVWLIKCPFDLPSAKVYDASELPAGKEAWSQLLGYIDATQVGPVGHLTRRHGDVIMFHTGEAGTYELTLPEGISEVKELYSGRKYNSSKVVVKTKGPGTFLFKAVK